MYLKKILPCVTPCIAAYRYCRSSETSAEIYQITRRHRNHDSYSSANTTARIVCGLAAIVSTGPHVNTFPSTLPVRRCEQFYSVIYVIVVCSLVASRMF
jgi:hypothetical protein